MHELIDRIVNLDIGNRGVAGLYAPARALTDAPLCLTAARCFAGLQPGERVFILTGSLTRSAVNDRIAENDGPIGAAVLARAITLGFNAIPVILADRSILGTLGRMTELAGPNIMPLEEAEIATALPRFTGVTVMDGISSDDAAAPAECKRLMETYAPKVVLSVERAGLTADGTYRNMLGQDYTEGRAKLDHVISEAAAAGIPTIGIGDGGNEIGMGAVKEAVHAHIPHGEVLCSEVATDVLIPAGVSNWGCYGVAASLAILTGNARLAHAAELERRLIESSASVGLVDGTTGMLDPTVDGLPVAVHAGLVEMLQNVVQRALR
ncbi:MAG: DUF4392 domain-containing protein [Alphaproteobacteria bacterium]|nr:DUF4392 domain-containing protein [Alphaproteobacteria bacterium]